jgi:hypothetical protein
VTEVIPRRKGKGYYYKVTYEDGDQEDLDDGKVREAKMSQERKN